MPTQNSEEQPNRAEERHGHEHSQDCRLEKLEENVSMLADAQHGSGDPDKIKTSIFERLSRAETELATIRKIVDQGLKLILAGASAGVIALVHALWKILTAQGKP